MFSATASLPWAKVWCNRWVSGSHPGDCLGFLPVISRGAGLVLPNCACLEAVGRTFQTRSPTHRSNSPPLMFGILALQFLFHAWVLFAPEGGEVLRDLHRPQIRGQDMNQDRHPPPANVRSGIDVVKLLDAHCNVRRGASFITDFRRAAIGERY